MGCTLPKQEQEERVKLLGDGLKKCSSHPTLLPDESFILSISEFNKDSKEFGGLSIRCRACSAIMRCLDKDIDIIRARHANLHHKHKLINDGYKYCPRCHETKPVSDFYTVRTKHPKKGRYHSYCKQCEVRYRAKWASGPLNRVRVRKSVRSNRNANPKLKWARYALCSHQRRFANVELTVDDILNTLKDQCTYCGCELIIGCNVSLDVKNVNLPITADNICISCKSCNSTKALKTPDEFMAILDATPELRKDILASNERLYKTHYAQFIPLGELKRMAKQCQ